MSRFVVVGFLALAWAFWELSGGADFVPPSKLARDVDVDRAEPAPAPEPAAPQASTRETPSEDANPALPRLALAEPPAPAPEQETAAEPPATTLGRRDAPADVPAPANAGALQPPAGPEPSLAEGGGLVLERIVQDVDAARLSAALEQDGAVPSLELLARPAATGTGTAAPVIAPLPELSAAPEPAEEPARDIREVTATRVNLREGPGVEYGVIDQLTEGARVEILWNPGAGWVNLRSVESGLEGWMAESLLTAPRG